MKIIYSQFNIILGLLKLIYKSRFRKNVKYMRLWNNFKTFIFSLIEKYVIVCNWLLVNYNDIRIFIYLLVLKLKFVNFYLKSSISDFEYTYIIYFLIET